MKKPFIIALALFGLITALFAACGDTGSTGNPNGPNPVHLNETTFLQNSIIIKKGESITLINDVSAVHIITNGTWDGTTAKSLNEPGAPKVEAQVQGGSSQTIGPFNTTGTFHLYCTIHPAMNLMVTVQ